MIYPRRLDDIPLLSDAGLNMPPPEKPAVSASTTAPTNQDVTVTAVYGAGCAEKQYSFDAKTWQEYTTTGVVMSSNGAVYFRGVNAEGGASEIAVYWVGNIDKTAPAAPTVQADTTAPAAGVTVTAAYSADSELREYRIGDGAWMEYPGSVVMKENGVVGFRGIDAAGNVSDITEYAVTNIGEAATTVAGEFFEAGGVFRMMSGGSGVIRTAGELITLSGSIDTTQWGLAAAGDFNGSGRDGMLWVEKSSGCACMQYDMTSFAEVNGKSSCLGVVEEGYAIKAAGDFSGSGIDGVLMQSPAFGDPEVSLNYGLAVWARDIDGSTYPGWLGALVNTWQEGDALRGDLSDPASINACNYKYDVVGVGDFDGDGIDDVMLQNTMPKTVRQDDVDYTITGSGDIFTFLTGAAAAIRAGAPPTVCYAGCATDGWSVVGFGDFDNDGVDDALLTDGTGIAGWKMANGQRQSDFWFGNLPAGYAISGVADVDADGSADIILVDAADRFSAWTVKDGAVTGALALK